MSGHKAYRTVDHPQAIECLLGWFGLTLSKSATAFHRYRRVPTGET